MEMLHCRATDNPGHPFYSPDHDTPLPTHLIPHSIYSLLRGCTDYYGIAYVFEYLTISKDQHALLLV